MTERIYTFDEIQRIVTPIAQRHRVTKMYLFGSYARGNADHSSDIDLRVVAAHLTTLFALGSLYAELEEALGKSLDLVTTESLRANKQDPMTRRLIRNIKKDEGLLYEELPTS